MTLKTSGLEFKRFYNDSKFWHEDTYNDDVLLHVDGRVLSPDADPSGVKDNAVVEIRSGWVDNIPADVAGGADGMSLKNYFLHWQKQQSTATLVVECPREYLEAVIAAVTATGGKVQGSGQ
ncbi:hypothetical protein WJ97_12420 [Burkholderia ubonensis]|uniref:hypothetical protein n=1 Tax=Burkholderia ubonensis TaxID=101571 RepID=UPI000752A3D6|nr:hypothetical protein [Burkholderia ubonensis]KVP96681.1 hypothetical protein WJ97_12420 [Burkholderia ubonensis]